jgi:NAD(P)-dependent dehydrogenase (short-subunit alcohol dehydrogenase family)
MRARHHPADLSQPRQIAGLIVFLCGPRAEDINGAALPIDGA